MAGCGRWNARFEGWPQQAEDAREWADVDYSRVVHSASFRRLQGKTQILNLGDSDFYRTRLTHSLEVAQIAGSVTRQLRVSNVGHPAVNHLPDLSLIQAVGLTHDLGHPPFGHGGEVALNYCMRERKGLPLNQSGFEGNGQTLRILTKLEKFSERAGANLARRTLLGVLKYPVPFSKARNPGRRPTLMEGPTTLKLIDRKESKPPKCYLDSEQEVVEWILKALSAPDRDRFTSMKDGGNEHHEAQHKSFDCSIMDLSDDIAFGVHDLEDAVALGLVRQNDFRTSVPEDACASYLDALKDKSPGETHNNVYESFVRMLFGDGRERKHAISRMVGHLITSCTVETIDELSDPLIRYRAKMLARPHKFLMALKNIVNDRVITSPEVQHLEFKGQRMVVSVFEALETEPKSLLPRDTLQSYDASDDQLRVICDHVSGMTDAYLLRTYERLFSPRMGSLFDKL